MPSTSIEYVPLAAPPFAVFMARHEFGTHVPQTLAWFAAHLTTTGVEFVEAEPSTSAPVELDDFGSFTRPVTEPEEDG